MSTAGKSIFMGVSGVWDMSGGCSLSVGVSNSKYLAEDFSLAKRILPHFTTRLTVTGNRITLESLLGMTPAAIAAIPTDELRMLADDLAELQADTKAKAAALSGAMTARYSDKASAARKASNKDAGAVTVKDGEHSVSADLSKTVTWDQALLAKAVVTLASEWNELPTDYVTVEYKVSEAKYNAWPPAIRKLFEPARTVKPGSQKFTFKEAK
jgi:hypothetical protein